MDTRTEELSNALNEHSEDEEETVEDDESQEEEDTEEKETDDGEEDTETEDAEDEEKDTEEDEDDDEKQRIKDPERWHGKSREDVIREIEALEKEDNKGKESKTKKKKETKKEDADTDIELPSDEELGKMTPRQFVAWVTKQIQSQVYSSVQERTKVQQSVTQEIRDAQKEHPLLKSSSEYRELVLALIDNAAQKGVQMPLKDACEKVDAFSGTDKGETTTTNKEKTRMKKAKAAVERGGGSSKSPDDGKGAEEKRLESVFGTGQSKSPLGGLGV